MAAPRTAQCLASLASSSSSGPHRVRATRPARGAIAHAGRSTATTRLARRPPRHRGRARRRRHGAAAPAGCRHYRRPAPAATRVNGVAVRFPNTSAQQRDVAGSRRDGPRKTLPLQDGQAVGCRLERPRVGAVLRDQLLDQTLRERDVGLRVADLAGLHQESEVVHEAPHRVRGVGQQARIEQRLPQHGGVQARQQRQAFARQAAVGQDRVIQLRQPFDGGLLAIRGRCGAAMRRRAARRGAAPRSPCSTRYEQILHRAGQRLCVRFVRCNAAFERATRTHRVGQFGDHALVDDRAVRGRRDADGAQLRARGA